jgi:hypothetical protein
VHSLHINPSALTGRPLKAAEAVADQLRAALALHNIPAHLVPLGPEVVVSLWHGLVAHCDGRLIWWASPHPSSRGHTLYTFAYAADTAAPRLARHYATMRGSDPAAVFAKADETNPR